MELSTKHSTYEIYAVKSTLDAKEHHGDNFAPKCFFHIGFLRFTRFVFWDKQGPRTAFSWQLPKFMDKDTQYGEAFDAQGDGCVAR